MEDAEDSDTGINNDYVLKLTSLSHADLSSRRAGMVEAIGPQVQVTSGMSVIYQGDVILVASMRWIT